MPRESPLVVPIAPAATHRLGDQSFVTMLRAADTGGRYSLMHWVVPVGPDPSSGDRHRHDRYEETFLVLEGALDFEVDDERITAGPSMWLRAPAGAPHTYTNTGSVEAHMLVMFSPGGMEDLFEEFGDPVGSDGPSRIRSSLSGYVEKARTIHGTEYGI